VKWQIDYDTAPASAKESGKPVFLLFQEVPGCAGCKQFGRDVLSDTAVVRGIEENFIPLLIPNNQPGRDAEVLAKSGEPAWNYQVIRFLEANGRDLIPRKDRVEGPGTETADGGLVAYLRYLQHGGSGGFQHAVEAAAV
jgi:Thioredoxin-like